LKLQLIFVQRKKM